MKKSKHKWLCGAVALSLAWGAQANAPDIGEVVQRGGVPIKVANVLDTDIRIGDGAGRGAANLDYPDATFLRVHITAERLPADATVIVADGNGNMQAIRSADIMAAGARGYYAMSMNGDHLSVHVNDAKGRPLEAGYDLRVDKVDVGFHRLDNGSPLGPSAVIGEDQRERAVCFVQINPRAFRHSRKVARVYGNGYVGTGWRVGAENRMLTSHQVMGNDQNPEDFEVWFNYYHLKCTGDESLAPILKVRGGQRLVGDDALNFQLFTIDEAQFDSVKPNGHLGLNFNFVPLQHPIYIPQHGAGGPRQLTMFVEGGYKCTVETVTQELANYKCDTDDGSSGSPVVDAVSNGVIALHHSTGAAGDVNQGTLMKAIWPKIQPYFANGEVPQSSP